jgi:hypothetical protein
MGEADAEGCGAKGERQRALEPEVQGAGALPTQIPDDPGSWMSPNLCSIEDGKPRKSDE